jgi:hypothetical protein
VRPTATLLEGIGKITIFPPSPDAAITAAAMSADASLTQRR